MTKNEFYERVEAGTIRNEIVEMMERTPVLCQLKGDNWYLVEEAITQLIRDNEDKIAEIHDRKEYLEHGGRKFEIVEKIPDGYVVWNIGKNMKEGYLPLCRETKDNHVDTNSLKAVRCDGALKIMSAVTFSGCYTAREMRKYLEERKDTKSRATIYNLVAIREALPYIEAIEK